jgi:hypothetical protein
LTLGASASDSNHIVAVSFSQSNATGQLVSAALTGCSGYVTTTQPYDFNQNLSNGSLTATFSSYIGVAPIAQGTCTIVVTPASGATLTIPVIVTP